MQAKQEPEAAEGSSSGSQWERESWRGQPSQQADDILLTRVVIRDLRWSDQLEGYCLMVLAKVRPEPLLRRFNHPFPFNPHSLSPLGKQDPM